MACFLLVAADVNPQGLPNITIPVNVANGITGDITIGLQTLNSSFRVDPSSSSTTTVLTNGQYKISISESPSTHHTIFHVEMDSLSAQPMQVNEIAMQLRFPNTNVYGVWSPAMPASQAQLIASTANVPASGGSDPNYGVPYIATGTASGQNVVSAGLLRQDTSVFVYGYPSGLKGYGLRLWIPETRTGSTLTEDFYVSTDSTLNWFDAAQDFSDWVDTTNGYQAFPVNSKCYEPLYDTWYWSLDQVDAQLYSEAAQAASSVGMGMFLADSGWDTPPGEFAKGLYGATGNYSPPTDEFPNMNATLSQIQGQDGLGYLLWMQPFAVGKTSTRYPATQNLHIVTPGSQGTGPSENLNLDPRTSGTASYVQNLISQIASTYKPSGFWIDFIDDIPNACIANHTHDYPTFSAGLAASLGAIREAIIQNVTQPVVYNRSTYANLNNKAYANVWQPTDSPRDFDLMRTRALQMRPFSRGVAFSSDQMYWPSTSDGATVAKFVMTSVMVGAPSLGGDIVHAPSSVLGIVSGWISFYRQHQADLNSGRFEPFGAFDLPNHKIETSDRTFAYIRNLDSDAFSVQGLKEIYILNATDSDEMIFKMTPPKSVPYNATIYDRYWNVVDHSGPYPIAADGTLTLDIAVEQGGAAVFTPAQ
jgi:hypothetical protein